MVEIRVLRPTVTMRMPTRMGGYRPRPNVMVVRRTAATHPSPTPQPTPCRLWQGAVGSDGYGWRKVGEGPGRKGVSMHRWVMSEAIGRKLKPTEVVLHACDNPLCYRVEHLSIGTVQDNNADMRAKGRDVKPPRNVFYGECHPMAKLSEAQVRSIRGHYQSGLAVKTIARMFEVAPSTIRRILKGVTWNTVGDSTRYVKPPTRDLLAEAKAKIEEEERSARAAAGGAEPSAAPRAERIRRVKHMTLTRKDDP
jgi:hypothetical protein